MADATPLSALASIEKLLSGEAVTDVEEVAVDSDSENAEIEETSQDETNSEIDENNGDEQQEDAVENDTLNDEDLDGFHLELDGEKIPLKEIKNGYMRQSDYTKKTQEVAKLRHEADEIARTAESKANELVKQRFEMVALDVEKRLMAYQNIDWKSLARQNPGEYTALQAEYNESINEAKTLQNEYYAITEQQKAKANEMLVAKAKETAQVLQNEIPNWGQDTYTAMVNFAKENGFDDETLSNIADAPTLRIIYKAMQFDRTSKEIKSNTKLKVAPSVTKVLKSNAKIDVNEDDLKVKNKAKIISKLNNSKSKVDRNLSAYELIQARLDGKI